MSLDMSTTMPLVFSPVLAQSDAPPALPGAPAPAGGPVLPPGPPGAPVTGASSGPLPPAPHPAADPGFFNPMNILFIALFLYLAYIFWDNSKKSKKRDQAVAALKKGDKIYTNGGIIGVIFEVDEPEVVIKLEDNQKMRILRSAIAGPYEPAAAAKPAE